MPVKYKSCSYIDKKKLVVWDRYHSLYWYIENSAELQIFDPPVNLSREI